ncbi:MAG: DUF177 domain-containing protein [Gammaproteobacteria bacterium]|nr:DUF177 domain-containing protein [Gammaproteobacteria bacterium]
MLTQLPASLDPYRAAAADKHFSGRISAGGFTRLASSVLAIAEEGVELDLSFGSRQDVRASLTGTVQVEVEMECQRCLGPMWVPVTGQFKLAFVRFPSEVDEVPDDLEAIQLDKPEIDLRALIEDELILALPLVPMHQESCQAWQDDEAATDDTQAGAEPKDNPFAVLAKLKQDS